MKGKYLNYQFSIFGDFSDISPNNSQNVIDLLSLYKDKNFIPSIFQEIPIGIIPVKSNNRIMLSNADGWNMNIGNNRVDLSMTYNEKGKYADMNIGTIIEEVKDIFKRLLELYNKKSNRIALNTTFLFDEEDGRKINDKFTERGNIINFYNENKSEEWNERYLSQKVEEKIDNEVINVGTALSKSSGEIGLGNKTITFNNGIILQFDINTTPKITTHRFDTQKINTFFDIAKSYKDILESDIQEIINNG